MTRCWHDDAATRPSFGDICVSIEQIVDAAEHLPLPGQSQSPVAPLPGQSHSPVEPVDQPSPTYSNFSFDSDEEMEEEEEAAAAHLYRNCVNARCPEMPVVVD